MPSDPGAAPPSGRAEFAGFAGVPGVSGAMRPMSALLTVVAVGILFFLIGWLAPILAPLGLGLFLTILAAPLFAWVMRRGRSAPVAMAVTVAVVLTIGGALVVLALVSAQTLTDSLAGYTAQLQARYPDFAATLASIGIPAAIGELVSPDALTAILRWVIEVIAQVGGNLIFATVIAALLLLDAPRIVRLGDRSRDNRVFRDGRVVANAAITYFEVRIRVNAVTAVGLLVLMLVVGVDDALLWAVGAFFLSFVPYLGLTLALIPPTILAFAETGPLAAAAIVVGGLILNVVAENILEPTMTGRALSLSTWLVFAMFFFWVWLIGPVGAILSMPITVLVVLVLQSDERSRWMAALMTRD